MGWAGQMTVRDLIDLLEQHGRLDDDVVVRCEITSSYTHDITIGPATTTEDGAHVLVLDPRSGVDRPLWRP